MIRSAVAVALVFGGTLFAAEPPKVLIVQQRDPIKGEVDPNLYVADFLANELDAGGRISSIVWGMSDPVFRPAALNGTLESVTDDPTLEAALAGALKLHAEYTIFLKAKKEKGKGKGEIKLFRGRRQIWKDDQTVGVEISGQSSDIDNAKSLARTWALNLVSKPLKDLKPILRHETPILSPGQQPPVIAPPPVEPIVVHPQPDQPIDNSQLKKELAAMVENGRRSEAIMRLRDAIDQAPLDLERRSLLIQTMIEQNPAQAAGEARRAASLFPDKPELRVLAARAWMRSGKPEEARKDLNEAVVRDPNGQATRLMLAEISLTDGKPDQALDHIEATLKPGAYAEGLFYRALCRSLLGGLDGLAQDLAESKKLEPNPLPDVIQRRYSLCASVYRAGMKRAVDDERSLLQKAMVKPKDQEVQDELERLERLAKARIAFLDGLTVPVGNRQAFEHHRLAASLISQSLMDLQLFTSSGDEDTLSEARINLSEAAKHLDQSDALRTTVDK